MQYWKITKRPPWAIADCKSVPDSPEMGGSNIVGAPGAPGTRGGAAGIGGGGGGTLIIGLLFRRISIRIAAGKLPEHDL